MPENKQPADFPLDSPSTESRKRDHIELAFNSQVEKSELDRRFYYEPAIAAHPTDNILLPFEFLGKTIKLPLWVSSMTGGTELAGKINQNLARACKDFGIGMGLGSCRIILDDKTHFDDFNVRTVMGNHLPLYANLGIAQIEELLNAGKTGLVEKMLSDLKADGLIIHINPLQEAMQPEGDRFLLPPVETIRKFLDKTGIPVIVKEVGQGMGYESMAALMKLPLQALDFGASGGTNFALLELLRGDKEKLERFDPLVHVGHSAEEMVSFVNTIFEKEEGLQCRQVIISGGIKNFLDGYYLLEKCDLPAVYGQASGFLKYARENYESLYKYVEDQVNGLRLAKTFLKLR